MIKVNLNNAAARAREAKERLENALVAAIDAHHFKLAEIILAEMERQGQLPDPDVIAVFAKTLAHHER
ncbi:hypothetical protein ACSFB1_12190, partial [Glaesserella parasuis]|uniref:hypothetical protein n=1 Tax=Glaesserella parasuis TaxID=738 RepID=UPI003F37271F